MRNLRLDFNFKDQHQTISSALDRQAKLSFILRVKILYNGICCLKMIWKALLFKITLLSTPYVIGLSHWRSVCLSIQWIMMYTRWQDESVHRRSLSRSH